MLSFYDQLQLGDTASLLQPLIDSGGYTINPEDGKIYNKVDLLGSHEYDVTGWIYVKNPVDFNCGWWRDIGATLNYIPTNCLNCWKVVVRPRNIQECFYTLEMQKKMVQDIPKCYCKVGIEQRPFVFANYGGYFYTRSMEEGLERHAQVREYVDKHVSKDVDVILKRGCTEYELDLGPSDQYVQPEQAKLWEFLIDKDCVIRDYPYAQPELIQRKTMKMWIKFAWDRADKSVLVYTANKPIVPQCVTYHNKPDGEK